VQSGEQPVSADHHVERPATVQILQQQSPIVDAVLAPSRRLGPVWRRLVIVAGRVRNVVARISRRRGTAHHVAP
jgi:hypothetical protein